MKKSMILATALFILSFSSGSAFAFVGVIVSTTKPLVQPSPSRELSSYRLSKPSVPPFSLEQWLHMLVDGVRR